MAQAPSILTPLIPEDGPAVPPPVPQKRQSTEPCVSPGASSAISSHRHSIASSPSRPGTKNFLLPAHARRYDEIIHLRQRVSALEKERESDRAVTADLRSELALFHARAANGVPRPAPDEGEHSRITGAEQRAAHAEARADRAEETVVSLRDRLRNVEKAKRREAAEAKRTATDLETQLRSLRDLILGQPTS